MTSVAALGLLLLITSPLSTSAKTRPATAGASAASNSYVVFVDGINTCSSSESDCNPLREPALSTDFGSVEKAVSTVGVPASHFVYFSYGALAAANTARGRYCQGWQSSAGHSECAPNGTLKDISAIPTYPTEDTHLSIVKQAQVLSWLLKQVPSTASINIMGFSLGGIISSYWAATHSRTSGVGRRIYSITLIDSPVGGVPAPAWFAGNACLKALGAYVCNGIYSIFSQYLFGSTVLNELRPDTGAKLLALLPRAARFPIETIQSTRDYLVNGTPIPFCFTTKTCSAKHVDLNLVAGRGAQDWKGIAPGSSHTTTNLGGQQLCYPASSTCRKALPGPLTLVYHKKGADPLLATLLLLDTVIPASHEKVLHNPIAERWFEQAVK